MEGVTVEVFAVSECQFEGLGQNVHIRRRVVPQGFQVIGLQQLEGLEQSRTLRPWSTSIDLSVLEGDFLGWLDSHAKVGQVLSGEESTILMVVLDNSYCNVPSVECISCRLQSCQTSTARCAPLLLNHVLENGS